MQGRNHVLAVLVAAVFWGVSAVSAETADGIFKELRKRPDDVTLMQNLKGALAGVATADERCRLGAIYCLGTLAYGDVDEGLSVRERMRKAFPSQASFMELSDDKIYDDCPKCEGGKTQGACAKCSGGKSCAVCGGGGKSKAKGFNGGELACPACRGSGTCAQCAGTGQGVRTCTSCYGRGNSLAKDKCRENYLRLLQPDAGAVFSRASGGGATAADPFAAPLQSAAVDAAAPRALKQTVMPTTISGYRIPVILPPVKGPVDPEIKAEFDAMVLKEITEKVQWLVENDKNGWSRIGAMPDDKKRMIEQERRNNLAQENFGGEGTWALAESAVEDRRREAGQKVASSKREAAIRAAELAEIEQEKAEKKAKSQERDEIERAVESAKESVKEQAAHSPRLREYPISYEEIDRATSSEYTQVQRSKTLQELWDRAKQHNVDPKKRRLFVPFPRGIKCTVRDVVQDRGGNYTVALAADEKTIGPVAKALAPAYFLKIDYPVLRVPATGEDVAGWKKNQVIDSEEWIITVLITSGGGIHCDRNVIRSEEEMAFFEARAQVSSQERDESNDMIETEPKVRSQQTHSTAESREELTLRLKVLKAEAASLSAELMDLSAKAIAKGGGALYCKGPGWVAKEQLQQLKMAEIKKIESEMAR